LGINLQNSSLLFPQILTALQVMPQVTDLRDLGVIIIFLHSCLLLFLISANCSASKTTGYKPAGLGDCKGFECFG